MPADSDATEEYLIFPWRFGQLRDLCFGDPYQGIVGCTPYQCNPLWIYPFIFSPYIFCGYLWLTPSESHPRITSEIQTPMGTQGTSKTSRWNWLQEGDDPVKRLMGGWHRYPKKVGCSCSKMFENKGNMYKVGPRADSYKSSDITSINGRK